MKLIVTLVTGLILLSGASKAEVICGKERPLKPVRCICGKIVNPLLEPLSDALVRVIQDGTDIATLKTGEDGKFQFPELKSGRYELAARFDGFLPFRSPIIVKNAARRCRRQLVIVLEVGGENCGSYLLKR